MTEPDYSLIVAAAGPGTRLREIANGTAKPLVEIAGRPILSWALERFVKRPPQVVAIVAHPDWLKRAVFEAKKVLPSLEIVGVKQPQPEGTLDALRRGIAGLGRHEGPLMFLHGDNIPPEGIVSQGLKSIAGQDNVVFSRITPWGGSSARLVRGTGGRPVGLTKGTDSLQEGEAEVCGGLFLFGDWIWSRFADGQPFREGETEVDSLVDELIRAGRALVLPAEGAWLHINTPDDYRRAQIALEL